VRARSTKPAGVLFPKASFSRALRALRIDPKQKLVSLRRVVLLPMATAPRDRSDYVSLVISRGRYNPYPTVEPVGRETKFC
jgi:hypothetical protein